MRWKGTHPNPRANFPQSNRSTIRSRSTPTSRRDMHSVWPRGPQSRSSAPSSTKRINSEERVANRQFAHQGWTQSTGVD